MLGEARGELGKGNDWQATEKLWGVAALAVKAYAYWRNGKRLTSHGELWEYKRGLEEEFGEWIHDSWANAAEMYICPYEGWCAEKDVENAYKRIEKLVKEIESLVKKKESN